MPEYCLNLHYGFVIALQTCFGNRVGVELVELRGGMKKFSLVIKSAS